MFGFRPPYSLKAVKERLSVKRFISASSKAA